MGNSDLLDYEKIGQNIRKQRKKCGLSQEQLAELAEISTTHMSHIETGSTKVSLPTLFMLSRALSCTLDEFVSEQEELSQKIRENSLLAVLQDCNDSEFRILMEIMKSTKKALHECL